MSRHNYSQLPELDSAEIQMEPLNEAPVPTAPASTQVSSPTTPQPEPEILPSETIASSSAPAPTSVAGPSVVANNDGVFSNVAAKPETPPKYEDDRLPSYGEVFQGNVTPGVFGAVVIPQTPSDILIDGMPVGNALTFIFSMIVSWLFGVVGFLCAYLMAVSHAGRCGARAGIGLQLIHWGVYMQSYMAQYDWYQGTNSSSYSYDSYPMPKWLSYVFMLAGWFLFIRACTTFFQVRRAMHLRLTGASTPSAEEN